MFTLVYNKQKDAGQTPTQLQDEIDEKNELCSVNLENVSWVRLSGRPDERPRQQNGGEGGEGSGWLNARVIKRDIFNIYGSMFHYCFC